MTGKHLFRLLLAMAAATFFAACASDGAQEPQDPQVAQLEVNEDGEYVFPEDDGDEMVCRRIRETGSHFPKTVCRSRRQLAEDERNVMESYGPLGIEAGRNSRF